MIPETTKIGSANVEPEIIQAAVSDLIKGMDFRYKSLVETALSNLAKDPNHYSAEPRRAAFQAAGKLTFFIPFDFLKKEVETGKECYAMDYIVSVWEIDKKTPLGALVHKIRDKIQEYGFSCDKAEVHLEKGALFSPAEYWHKDGDFRSRNFITVCFSNKPKWSTMIADIAKVRELIPPFDHRMIISTQSQIIDSIAFPAIHGDLWHANNTLHRGPKASDLHADPNTPADWRLLIRFS